MPQREISPSPIFDFCPKNPFFWKKFQKTAKTGHVGWPVLAKIEKNEKISAKSPSDEGGFNLFYSNMVL